MPKLLLLLKLFNTVVAVVISAAVGFLSLAFFLGSRENYQLLRQHLVENFLLRFGAFALLGIALSVLPILINLLAVWRTSSPVATVYRFGLKAVAASVIGALSGTAVFFSH